MYLFLNNEKNCNCSTVNRFGYTKIDPIFQNLVLQILFKILKCSSLLFGLNSYSSQQDFENTEIFNLLMATEVFGYNQIYNKIKFYTKVLKKIFPKILIITICT